MMHGNEARAVPTSAGAARAAPLFAPTVLMAMLIALLCALLPTGLPLTSQVGSAFSPSTTLVSLSAPSSARITARDIIEDEGDTPDAAQVTPDRLPPLAVAPQIAARIERAPAPFASHRLINGTEAGASGAARPRAPPRV